MEVAGKHRALEELTKSSGFDCPATEIVDGPKYFSGTLYLKIN